MVGHVLESIRAVGADAPQGLVSTVDLGGVPSGSGTKIGRAALFPGTSDGAGAGPR